MKIIPARLSPATFVLILAGLIALASAGLALSRSGIDLGGGGGDTPAAADWRVVGWAYAERGNAAEAAAAYRKASALEPRNGENWSSLGEVLQSASRVVVPEAAEAFAKAIALDASDPRARYFIAVQKDLAGNHQGALDAWLALLADTPPGAPWQADLKRTIEQSAARNKITLKGRMPASPPTGTAAMAGIPGPTPDQLAAASSIPPSEQDAMVQGMVERLATRLRTSPRDADGWIRLMRSRKVLREDDAAQQALRDALAAFADDQATQGRLRAAAADLGIS